MRSLIILTVLSATLAVPAQLPGYVFPTPSNPIQPVGPPSSGYQAPSQNGFGGSRSFNNPPGVPNGGVGGGYQLPAPNSHDATDNCPEDQVQHADGSCVQPEVSRTIFVYDAPQQQFDEVAAPEVPKPKLHYNIVFVRTPEGPADHGPIVVPPPQQKTLVYVLNKGQGAADQQVIEVPAPEPHKPEVFYINFKEGENPQLPIGIDLESALASVAAQQGQVVNGGGAGGAIAFGGANFGGNGGGASFGGNGGGASFGGNGGGASFGGNGGGASFGGNGGGASFRGNGGASFGGNGGASFGGGAPSNVYGSPRTLSNLYGSPEGK